MKLARADALTGGPYLALYVNIGRAGGRAWGIVYKGALGGRVWGVGYTGGTVLSMGKGATQGWGKGGRAGRKGYKGGLGGRVYTGGYYGGRSKGSRLHRGALGSGSEEGARECGKVPQKSIAQSRVSRGGGTVCSEGLLSAECAVTGW